MDYAVIEFAGHQFKVEPGSEITVNRLDAEQGNTVEVTDVLLIVKDGKFTIGTPYAKDAKVNLKVLEHTRSGKIPVRRFKSKSRYRRHKSHRQPLTVVRVEKVISS
jgi:large subunit ribosomal protein L21